MQEDIDNLPNDDSFEDYYTYNNYEPSTKKDQWEIVKFILIILGFLVLGTCQSLLRDKTGMGEPAVSVVGDNPSNE